MRLESNPPSYTMASFEKISFGGESSDTTGYELVAETPGAPCVICLQEWWGVNEGIRQQARKIHALGYGVLIPDLYKGKIGIDAEEAHHLMSNMDWGVATREICEAAEYLRRAREAKKVGIIGFCMGGALTLIAAEKANVDCAAPFYGTPGADACDVSAITIPVQAHFGKKDNLAGFSDLDAARKLETALKGDDKRVFLYDGVGHAFMNVSPEPYADFAAREAAQGFPPLDETAVNLAWSRVEEFFAKQLAA